MGNQGEGVYTKLVRHPDHPRRRQLPLEKELMPELVKVGDQWAKKVLGE